MSAVSASKHKRRNQKSGTECWPLVDLSIRFVRDIKGGLLGNRAVTLCCVMVMHCISHRP